ncbi:Copper-exporting P-type ATPase A [Planctomycetes bacterium MalM25]|nr:Copper-exporting P-type ATPase A [Planctomycetes bacterium MalM25]
MSAGTLDKPAETAVLCDHCGLTVPAALQDAAAEHPFCCGGCEVAYETIHGCGLDAYYAYRDRLAEDRHASRGVGKQYASFDSEVFQERHVATTGGGYRTIDLRLEGVHCAACVWLVERLPQIVPGVVDARLSLGVSRARVVWDPDTTALSAVATALDRLGYAPHPARDASAREAHDRADRKRLINLAIAGALAGNNMLIAVALYAGVFDGIEPHFERLFRWLSMAIGWLSLAWPGTTFFRGAWAACRARTANLDQPIVLALAVGALAGTANVLLNRGEVYFDSLSVLVFLLLVGRFLQSRQQRWAEEAIGLLLAMTPDSCRVVRGDRFADEAVDALEAGDLVEVRPGELLPADGEVTTGQSTIDQSLLTGESRPVPVEPGDAVCAGAQNVSGTLRVSVGAVGEATRLGKLLRLVEEGLAEKPPVVLFADRVAGWFVAGVVTLAAINFTAWAATSGFAAAIDSTVALLIVACPCALGLATPLTMAIAIGRGSKRGMLIKSASVLERLARVDRETPGRLFLDKTGTLTSGEMRVVAWRGDETLKPWVAALEGESPHPIGAALAGLCEPSDANDLRERVELHGYGVTAHTPVGELLVGSPRFAEEQRVRLPKEMSESIQAGRSAQHTVVVVALKGLVEAVVWLSDTLQDDASDGVKHLRQNGWRAEILSGDAPEPVAAVASEVGLPDDAAHALVTPEEKLARVQTATAGESHPTVMMVGDGVNDAAALAAADVGVAVHGGAEASLAAADVYLTEPGLGKLVELVELGRRTMRTTRRNLVISLAYNTLAVGFAAAGWITPLAAALLMPLSSLTVLASAVGFSAPQRVAARAAAKPRGG